MYVPNGGARKAELYVGIVGSEMCGEQGDLLLRTT
jgi:hypothetical protein